MEKNNDDAQNPFGDFNIAEFGKERVAFELILWQQIAAVNRILSGQRSHREHYTGDAPEDIDRKGQVQEAIEALDAMCESLKDDKFEEAMKPLITEYKKYKKDATEKISQLEAKTENKYDQEVAYEIEQLEWRLKNRKYKLFKERYKQLIKLLDRQGRLFKNQSEGGV